MSGFKKRSTESTDSMEHSEAMRPSDLIANQANSPVVTSTWHDERRIIRGKVVLAVIVLFVLCGISFCITGSTPMFISPLEVVQTYGAWLGQIWSSLLDPASVRTATELMQDHPFYYWTLTNFGTTWIYLISGAMLSLAGMLYQNVFRNPIAAPSMLGVSSGVQLGIALLVLFTGVGANALLGERYLLCYVCVVVILVLLFVFTRLMTGKKKQLNVVNMLLVGTLINQLVGIVVTYITWYMLDDEMYEVYAGLTSMTVPTNHLITWVVLLLSALVVLIPVVLLRFHLNALAFAPEEMSLFGINASRLRLIALICGTIAMITAQIIVGTVAMITLVVPQVSRAYFGSEFRKQLLGVLLLGAITLVACHIVAQLIPIDGSAPLSVAVNLLLMPAFVWIIATQQRKWE